MKRVLLAPLDWGLGHATRCIPIIRELQAQGCEVLVAGSGDSLRLLRKEFPGIHYFEIPGYNPRYPLRGSMVMAMATQLPRFVRVILSEHRAVEKIVRLHRIDLVISDNRYGCWAQFVPSVFITHQSNILMPKRFGFLSALVRKSSEYLINRFHFCWIPDFPEGNSLAGELISFGKMRLRTQVRYIGWLSRFVKRGVESVVKYDVLAVMSGPEPQRSELERQLLPQLRSSNLRFRLVRGLPSAEFPNDGEVVNFLASEEMQEHIESAALIIARSGYSTVMDLMALGKKAVFIPTPGQTEQEYLAELLKRGGIAYSMSQREFNLALALTESKNYAGFNGPEKNTLLAGAVRELTTFKLPDTAGNR